MGNPTTWTIVCPGTCPYFVAFPQSFTIGRHLGTLSPSSGGSFVAKLSTKICFQCDGSAVFFGKTVASSDHVVGTVRSWVIPNTLLHSGKLQVSSDQNRGWLGCKGDYTTYPSI